MTKADIAEQISQRCALTRKDSQELLDSVLHLVKSTLGSGESIKISGFGSFQVRHKNPRKGRNPQTGDAIILDSRRVITFKCSSVLKSLVNGKEL